MSSRKMALAGDLRPQLQHPQHSLQQMPDHGMDQHRHYGSNKPMAEHYSHTQPSSNMGLNMLPHMASTASGAGNAGNVVHSGMKRSMNELGVNVNPGFNSFSPQQRNMNFPQLGQGNFSNMPLPAGTMPKRIRGLESNSADMSPRGFGSSRYKGVCWNKKQKKWRTRLSYQGKVEFLGDFPDEESAALAYDRRVKELYGNNSKRLNFPEKIAVGKDSIEAQRFQGDQSQVKNRVTPVGLKQLLLQQIQDDAKAHGMGVQFPKNVNTAVKENTSTGEVEVATQAHKKFLIGANRYYLGSSQYKGVCWNKKKKKWRARISNNGKREFLGDWDSEVKAAMIYDARARQLFRNVPNLRDRLNFPDGLKSQNGEQSDQAFSGPSLAAPSNMPSSATPLGMYRGWPDQSLLGRNTAMNHNKPMDGTRMSG